ncbi:hypothetical protein [Novosphingobium lindaniclasticum]|jgi:hypothetical protein|uniref:HTH DNA binding domain-containing protein n=1 Tax=Novosphingobium lindaniclasticum LE124 TaxID=1096930 RepID=T0HE29_9SPHN|nr:hypothetical protein [Novosphingobium lindaniclasticum]EQB10338.1 hypothetical protein L284_17520 [Novosphingobium lindaniclasticum LE124]
MNHPPLPLCALAWTPDLVSAIADASSAIGRLDARISATVPAPAWHLRASWMGYARALQLQKFEIEEIDIISRECGLQLAGRPRLETAGAPLSALEPWRNRLAEEEGRHWREDLPFSFDLPTGWDEAPALARALALLDDWARRDRTITPWLALPMVLRRMGLTQRTLPCLVTGDPGQRFVQGDRPALLKRLLKQLRRSAEDGLTRLERLENAVQRSAAAISAQHRSGKLTDLGRLALTRPCLAARSLAPRLDLTVSGAGKLLERATRLGLLVEISGRGTWRSYVTPDIAVSLGLVAPMRGRPRLVPAPSPTLDSVLAAFDAELAEFDTRIAGLGGPDLAGSTINN